MDPIKKSFSLIFSFVLSMTVVVNTIKAQVCSGTWAVGSSLNFICITGVSIGLSNGSLEPAGCPLNPVYTSGQSNTFIFDYPVSGFTIDFKSFSSQAGCARMELKINGLYYPLTVDNLIDIPIANGCTGFFSFIALTNEGFITSSNNSLSSSNGHARIIINDVNANSVTISTNDPLGTIVSAPFNCLDVVPLKLTKFNGYNDGCKGILDWETGVELNIKNIEVQRSENGFLFNKVGDVKAKGSNSQYSFVTANASDGYFRIKILDIDGSYDFSEIIYLKSSCNTNTYSVVPNPTTGVVKLLGLKSEELLLMSDVLGKTLQIFQNNQNNNTFDLRTFTPGMYIFRVMNAGKCKAILKVIKN